MIRSFRHLAFIVVLGFFTSCPAFHCPKTKTQTQESEPLPAGHIVKNFRGKVYAIGDLHGDLAQTYRALTIAGAIDANHRWIGKDRVVVQTGDQMDRGDEDKKILDELERLAKEAPANGSLLIILNGNHELMNTQLDFRYTTKKANLAFVKGSSNSKEIVHFAEPPYAATIEDLLKSPTLNHYGVRALAFAPGKDYAVHLSHRSFYAIVNDSVFVHGGIGPEHVQYGLEKLNDDLRSFFEKGTQPPRSLLGEKGPFWLRDYSMPPNSPVDAAICAKAAEALRKLDAKRMVVGHTIQSKINSACNDTIWRIDIGMSKAYGNRPAQVLEIDGENVRVLDQALPMQNSLPAKAVDHAGLR